MIPSSARAVRALCVLVACSFVWLAAGAFCPAAPEQRPVAGLSVMVSRQAPEARVALESLREASAPAMARGAQPAESLISRAEPLEPANTTSLFVLVEDRYLRNLALLS